MRGGVNVNAVISTAARCVSAPPRGRHNARIDAQRIVELERENRHLKRSNARLELFEEIRKKAAGLLGLEFKSPDFDEND